MTTVHERAFGLSAIALLLLAVAPRAAAIELRADRHTVVGAGEVIADDLYATGETVTIHGRIEGDLIASGREVRVDGEVTGDLIACGQAVIVDGIVGDDVRMAAMALQLGPRASIGDDVVAAAFSLETMAGSATAGSLLVAGFQALLAGDLGEGLNGALSSLELRGRIGGNSEVEIGGDPQMRPFTQYMPSPIPLPQIAGGLTVAEGARIDGRLEYASRHEARGPGATSAALTRTDPAPGSPGSVERRPAWPGRVLRWVGLIVLGLVLAWLVPGWLGARSDEIASRPLLAGGVGLGGAIGLPVAALVVLLGVGLVGAGLGLIRLGNLVGLLIVLGLVAIGLAVLLFWLSAAYLAPLVVGLSTGRWLVGRFDAERARGLVLPMLAGLVLLAVLRFVPFVGGLVALVVVLVGWGAVLLWLGKPLRRRPDAA